MNLPGRHAAAPTGGRIPIRSAGGFTLVELLVGIGVTVLLLVTLMQIFGSTQHIAQMSQEEMNARKAIRSVVDALAGDLQNMADQKGMTLFLKGDAHHCAQLAFFTQSRPPANASGVRLMAVVYQLSGGNQVIRKSAPVGWDDANPLDAIDAAAASTSYSILADGILLFEPVLETEDANIVPGPQPGDTPSGKAYLSGTTLNGASVPGGFLACVLCDRTLDAPAPRVRRLNVSIAALDPRLLRLPNAQGLAAALQPGDLENGQIPCVLWNRVISQGQLNNANFPKPAVVALQVGQRTFPLKP